MKSERRHELTTNVLADWLAGIAERIRPYQTTLLGILLLAILLGTVLVLLINRYVGETAKSWEAVYSGNPGSLSNLAEKEPTTPVGAAAGLLSGDACLREATQQRFVNQAAANQKLSSAVEFYQRVMEKAPTPLAREQAAFGLARTLETQGKVEDAIKAYEALKSQWPDGAYADYAAKRVADLKTTATQEFYDKFAHFLPKPSAADEGGMPSRAGLSRDALPEAPEEPSVKGPTPFKGLQEDIDAKKGKPTEPTTPSPSKSSPAEPKK
ncbi:MAG: tetratricopeptide repeat protein [Thermoguttaceae bacterium]